jgi:hypothetical protein
MDGRTFNCREENVLHQILATSVVKPSLDLGLLGYPKGLTIDGDGPQYESVGSPFRQEDLQVRGQVRLQATLIRSRGRLGLGQPSQDLGLRVYRVRHHSRRQQA